MRLLQRRKTQLLSSSFWRLAGSYYLGKLITRQDIEIDILLLLSCTCVAKEIYLVLAVLSALVLCGSSLTSSLYRIESFAHIHGGHPCPVSVRYQLGTYDIEQSWDNHASS